MDLLTQAERDRFAEYADFEATSCSGIADQMKKSGVTAAFREHAKRLAAAYRIVSADLMRVESMEIGGKPEAENPKTGE